MGKYQYVLFDLDGTLTDPGEGITNAVKYSLNKFGISVAPKSDLYKFIGPPLVNSFMDFYGFSKEKANQAVQFYREYYKEKGIFENTIFPGTKDLLKILKSRDKTIILATSKPQLFAQRILEYFGINGYFSFVAGASLDGTRMQKSEVISYALAESGITDKSAVLMVGDREYDIIGAKTIGIDCIGVLFGYGTYKELESAGATYIAENFEDIKRIIL